MEQTTPVVYSRVVDSVEGSAPVLAFKEYLVPPMGELEGYGERFATIKYTMRAEGDPTTLSLLDFTTGKTRQVVAGAVNFKDDYDIVGVSGGDRWVTWEETNGENGYEGTGFTWKLYAASIDATSQTCGKAILVDEADLDNTSRPLFRVEGDSLYWMTNTVAGGRPNPAAKGAVVMCRNLKTGAERTVCETKLHYARMSVGDGKVVVAEQGSASEEVTVRVFDPLSSNETWSLNLRNTDELGHFPLVHDGTIAWAVFAPGGTGCPDLFYRGADGVTHRIRDTASDPTQVGRYIFYDGLDKLSHEVEVSPILSIIGGYDTTTNETFTILDGIDEADAEWDMPMARGYSPDTFVISNDSPPSTATAADWDNYHMRIRRYTVPAE